MKKLLFLSLLIGAINSTNMHAQSGPAASGSAQSGGTTVAPDRAAMLKQMKENFKMPMVEKTGLTEAQVDRVIEINLDIRLEAATTFQGLNEADRSKKIAELKAEKEKRYAAIPLTAEQIKSVYAFYEDLGKNRQQKSN